jgi:hypothetical protein
MCKTKGAVSFVLFGIGQKAVRPDASKRQASRLYKWQPPKTSTTPPDGITRVSEVTK